MKSELINEIKVNASSNDIWEVYSSPDLLKFMIKLLPDAIERIDYVEGNGGVGTILQVGLTKISNIDNGRRFKEVQQIDGGYLAMGVTFFMERFEIIETSCNSCIIRSMIEYEVPAELAAKISPLISIDGFASMATIISNYVLDNKKNGYMAFDN
ncbi:hypothetical protein MKX03_009075 [Papaver bracteatum]|nr:hypothetical protein MKX03_009075 [Papaver bracteatum]